MQSGSTNRRYLLLFFTILLVCLLPAAILRFDAIRAALGGSNADPVAIWHFDEGVDNTCSGGTNDACDSSGNVNDGAFGATTAAPTWQTEDLCVSGKCLYFDGTNDYSDQSVAADFPIYDYTNISYSISFWVKANPQDDVGRIYHEGSNGTASPIFALYAAADASTLTLFIRDNNGATSISTDTNAAVFDGNWHHFAITDDDGTVNMYVDGKLDKSTSYTNADTVPLDESRIGSRIDNSLYFNGFLDEFKVFADVLSADQIKAEFAGGAAVLGVQDNDFLNQGLIGYWPLDHTSGNATDASGNSLTLTNNNTVAYQGAKFGNGGEFVPASSEHFSTTTTINSVHTVSFWVNPDSNSNTYISLTTSTYINSSSGTISTVNFSNPTVYVNGVESSTIAADAWQLVTVVSEGGTNADQFYIGRQGTNYFDGTMDEVRLYNRALSPAEVRSLYIWALGPVAYWNFDEGSGTSIVFDKSGSGLNGTMEGTFTQSSWVNGKFGNALSFNGTSNRVSRSESKRPFEKWRNVI